MINEVFEFLEGYLKGTDPFNRSDYTIKIESNYLPQKSDVPADATIKLYITLLNIEEERSNKKPNRYVRQNNGSNFFEEFNPEVMLNLYIMFSGYCSDYFESLKSISNVIKVFANEHSFSAEEIKKLFPDSSLEKLTLDLYNISLDQNNSLWQAMATNVLPHVIYKVRTVTFIPYKPIGEAGEVTEVKINAENK